MQNIAKLAPAAETLPDTSVPIVEFRNASKSFGAMQVLQDVDLKIRPGEFVCLLGPSGCGKSTLLNLTAGLLQPSKGSAHYRGEKITGINVKTGYMTQNDHLLPWRTVRRNIAVPLELAGWSKADTRRRTDELLKKVGLEAFADSYPSQLSGGMRKRCALARILAYDPETLLLDEPFGALDAQLRLLLQIELRNIVRESGKSVLFVTHDVDEAVALADRCVVFSARPASVRHVINFDLPEDRDLKTLRYNPKYQEECARLWKLLTPELDRQAALGGKS